VVWFRGQGFPRGRLGEMLALLYEIKANGLESLVRRVAEQEAPAEDGPAPRTTGRTRR
jgi:hypothetical protein